MSGISLRSATAADVPRLTEPVGAAYRRQPGAPRHGGANSKVTVPITFAEARSGTSRP